MGQQPQLPLLSLQMLLQVSHFCVMKSSCRLQTVSTLQKNHRHILLQGFCITTALFPLPWGSLVCSVQVLARACEMHTCHQKTSRLNEIEGLHLPLAPGKRTLRWKAKEKEIFLVPPKTCVSYSRKVGLLSFFPPSSCTLCSRERETASLQSRVTSSVRWKF